MLHLTTAQTKYGQTLLHKNKHIYVSGSFVPCGEPIVRNGKHYIVLQVNNDARSIFECIDTYCNEQFEEYTPCLSGTQTILVKVPFRYKKYEVQNAHKLFEEKPIVATLKVEGVFDSFCSIKLSSII